MLATTQWIDHDTLVVVSDLHLGDPDGGPVDEFDREADFERLLLEIVPDQAGGPATLVLAGDFVDFTQVLPHLAWHGLGRRFGSRELESLWKFRRVRAAHPRVFAALAEFLARGGQVLLLPGNHDIDWHWPALRAALRAAVGGVSAPQLAFVPQGCIHERGLYIEHGNQYTHDNRFDHWRSPIVTAADGPRLERPWGTLFMELVYSRLHDLRPHVYRLLPAGRLARLLVESIFDPDEVSRRSVARLAAFCATTGVRPLARRLLSDSNAARFERTVRATQAEVIVTAHTHAAVDGVAMPREPWEDHPRRLFNTGSWVRRVPAGATAGEVWQCDALHDLRYLLVELAERPRARLERLAATPLDEELLSSSDLRP